MSLGIFKTNSSAFVTILFSSCPISIMLKFTSKQVLEGQVVLFWTVVGLSPFCLYTYRARHEHTTKLKWKNLKLALNVKIELTIFHLSVFKLFACIIIVFKRLAKWVVAVLHWIWTITEAPNLHHISPLSIIMCDLKSLTSLCKMDHYHHCG